MRSIFSIGHSNHSWDMFRGLIEASEIGLVIDVRSSPRSRYVQFCKTELRYRLNLIGISYLYLGDSLGGMGPDTGLGYDVMAQTPHFQEGISQVLNLAPRARLALLCAEHEPLECHRCLLVGRHLSKERDVQLAHILRDGRIEEHTETENRLMSSHGLDGELLGDRDQRLVEAYSAQELKLGVMMPKKS